MILKVLALIFLVGIYGTKKKSLEQYNIEFFVDTIKQLNENASSSANNCLKRNKFNQYLCISAKINESSTIADILHMYTLIIGSYEKIKKSASLSVLAVEKVEQHIIINQSLCHYVFSYYCNIISTIVDDERIYHFNNQFLSLTFLSYKRTKTAYDLSNVLSKKNYNMIIFENCIDTEDDITFIYNIFSDCEKKYEGPSEHLQMIFALKFENKSEVDAWNKLKIDNLIYIANTIIKEQKFKFLNLSISDMDVNALSIKRRSKIDCKDPYYLTMHYNILKMTNNIARTTEQAKKILCDKYVPVLKARADTISALYEKNKQDENCYIIKVVDYIYKFYVAIVITNKAIKNLSHQYKKCISIYLYNGVKQKLICRYCYIAKQEGLCRNLGRNASRVIELIDGGLNFINFRKNFLLYLNTPFKKISDYLPFDSAIYSSKYSNWYVEDSFYVNHTNLSNTVSYKCVFFLTKMLSNSINNYTITILNANIKNFVHQIYCNYLYNIFNIITIKNVITQNSLTQNNFKEFEIVI